MAVRHFERIKAHHIERALQYAGDFHVLCGPVVFNLYPGRVDVELHDQVIYMLQLARRPEVYADVWELTMDGYQCRVLQDVSGEEVLFEVIDMAADPQTGAHSVIPTENGRSKVLLLL